MSKSCPQEIKDSVLENRNFDIDQLQVISGDSEFDTEYCITLGFSYLGNMLEWDEDGETTGSYRKIKIFDIEKEEVILEF